MNENIKSERVRIINFYLTPLAIILVLMAIVFSQPLGWALYGSVILLGFGLINNMLTVTLVKRFPGISNVRMVVNVLINIILVYLLVGYWGPIWYLFLMTPVATAVYSNRLKTFIVSLIMSGLLLGIYAVKGISASVAWGQALCRVILLIFLSLFINALVNKS